MKHDPHASGSDIESSSDIQPDRHDLVDSRSRSSRDDSPPPVSAEEVFCERLGLAIHYRDLLSSDGITRGLIGPREVPRLWERHIVNCAVIGETIDDGQSVIDIGSGAGLPGIPLALARPDLRITLIEPLLRRTTFLEEVVSSLGLDVTVIRGRAEEKSVLDQVELADVVTSRALAPLARLAKWSAPLIRVDGRLVAIKGSSAHEEIARDGDVVKRLGIDHLSVQECGTGLIDPPTTVVVGVRTSLARGVQRSTKKRSDRHGRSGSRNTGR